MNTIALIGNPNSGKTSLFNALTGTVQHVSNYPGVTVERKEGVARLGEERCRILDLPGIYSLTAYSQEERVARDCLLKEQAEVIVDVVDASNLERNLYLCVQLMELGKPLVIALNMVDVAKRRGICLDKEKLTRLLGVPVVETVGHRGLGTHELLTTCREVVEGKLPAIPHPVTYGHEVNREVVALADSIQALPELVQICPPSWLAVKLLEEDEDARERLDHISEPERDRLLAQAAKARRRIHGHFNEDVSVLIAERRYGFAAGAIREVQCMSAEVRQHITDHIDGVVCNRYLGPLVLLMVVTSLFFFIFKLSDEWKWLPWFTGWKSPTEMVGLFFDAFSTAISGLQASLPMVHSLLDDGIISGVGGVVEFVPLIFFLFLFVSFLEDTGYIARVAFILDRVMRAFGLQGKSILALIVSGGLGAGGCAVPGVLATRTLREEKDRLVTMLVVPFMNCGAKMPVYALLIAAFFPDGRTRVMLLLWAVSWVVTLLAAWALRKWIIRGEQTPFVMELPPYHLPTPRGLLTHTWERTWMYIKKAGTLILAVNIVMWALVYFPRPPEPENESATVQVASQELAHSFAGRLGKAIEPVSIWAGFDWQTNIALIGGFAAKELVVSTMGTVYAMDTDSPGLLSQKLAARKDWGGRRALALMLFVMLYAPCLPTVAAIRKESGSWKWAAFAVAYSTALAFILAVGVYQTGRLFS